MSVEFRVKRRALGLGLMVFLAAFALYAPSVGYDFVHLDDVQYIIENPMVSGGLSGTSFRQAFSETVESYWAPLLWISFMLDVEWFGLNPWGFHLVNVLLFALNAVLLFALVWRWSGRAGIALATALLWAWHPARVESVAWITERKDVLSGLFFLLGVGAYVEGRRGHLRHGVALAWACMLLGGMAKQIVIVIPAVLMLLDVWPLGRTDWTRMWRDGWRLAGEKWAFWALAAGLAALPLWFHHTAGAYLTATVGQRLRMIPIHYLFYLEKSVWPTGLAVLLADQMFTWARFASGVSVLAGVTVLVWRKRQTSPWALMGWLWFAGTLFPLSGVVWAGSERIAARFLYLPQIGLILAAVLAADAFLRRRSASVRTGAIVCALVLAGYAGWTLWLLPHWRDSRALFRRVLAVNPHSHHAFENLGHVLYQDREYAQWQAFLEEQLLIHPANYVAAVHYAWWQAAMMGRPEPGLEAWSRATGARPVSWTYWTLLENATLSRGLLAKWQEVAGIGLSQRGDYRRMAALRAHWDGTWDVRAQENFLMALLCLYWNAGLDQEAASLAEDIAAIGQGWPTTPEEMFGRLANRWEQGARGYAYLGFRDYARWRPEDGLAFNNMAWMLATAEPDGLNHAGMDEWPAQALAWAERAVELIPDPTAIPWNTLAAARANAGDFSGAVAAARTGLALAESAGDAALAERIRRRLEVYRDGRPWREPPPASPAKESR